MAATSGHQPAKCVIALRTTTKRTHGHLVNTEWIWSETHKAHIYLGRELSVAEFDECWEKCWANRGNYEFKPIFLPCCWTNLTKARDAKRKLYDGGRTTKLAFANLVG